MRRDVGVALALTVLTALAVFLAASAGGGGGTAQGSGATRLPPGWRSIERPLTSVLYPEQVLAAATYPVVLRQRPRSCTPRAALRQMPADGVLVEIIKYGPRAPDGNSIAVPRMPPRPRHFAYAEAARGPFECAGLSYKFEWEQDGRALQAHIWMDPATVDRRSRAQALRILDSFG